MRILAFSLGLFSLMGCTRSLDFAECTVDADCVGASGEKLHCTPDRLCVSGRPRAELCKEVYPLNAPANSIVVGAIAFLTDLSDVPTVMAYKLAIDQINPRRSPEPPLALHICDVGEDDLDPLKSMQILVRERGAVAVLGPTSSGHVFAVKDEVLRSGVPIITPSSTSPEISAIGDDSGPVSGLFFRTVPSDNLQAPVLARLLPSTTPLPKVSLLYVDDPYGEGFKDAFLRSYRTNPPRLTVKYTEPAGTPDFQGIKMITDLIKADPPDYLVAIVSTHAEHVTKALLDLAPTTQIVMTDGAKDSSLLMIVGTDNTSPANPPYFTYTAAQMDSHLSRIIGTAPTVDVTTGAYLNFANDYAVRFPGENAAYSVYTPYGYDAMYALGIAIAAAGSDATPARVAEMLARFGGTPDASGESCRTGTENVASVGTSSFLQAKNRILAGGGVTLSGSSGSICFTPHGDRGTGVYEKWRVDTTNHRYTSEPIP